LNSENKKKLAKKKQREGGEMKDWCAVGFFLQNFVGRKGGEGSTARARGGRAAWQKLYGSSSGVRFWREERTMEG